MVTLSVLKMDINSKTDTRHVSTMTGDHMVAGKTTVTIELSCLAPMASGKELTELLKDQSDLEVVLRRRTLIPPGTSAVSLEAEACDEHGESWPKFRRAKAVVTDVPSTVEEVW